MIPILNKYFQSFLLLNDKKIALRFALIIMKKSFVVFGGSFLFLFSREQKYLRSQRRPDAFIYKLLSQKYE